MTKKTRTSAKILFATNALQIKRHSNQFFSTKNDKKTKTSAKILLPPCFKN